MKVLLQIFVLSIVAAATLHAEPVNDKCPVCGKTARLIFRAKHQGKHIIFFSAECLNKFEKAPSSFTVKPKA
ncbi:MAG: hypothetical protein ACOYMN_22765 [Roseimicrobium sp.]